MTTPQIQLYGLDITSAVSSDGTQADGPNAKISDYPSPNFPYPSLSFGGISDSSYKLQLLSGTTLSISDMKEIMAEANQAPEGSEFFPFDSSHSVYVLKATASRLQPSVAYVSGSQSNIFESSITINPVDNYLYGANQVLYSGNITALPKSLSITNSGTEASGIDYLLLSGYRDITTGKYTTGVTISLADYTIDLIDKMARYDTFILDRFGHIRHRYETDFSQLYAQLQKDLHGSDYVDYGSSGTMAHEAFYMYSSAKLLAPMYGPRLAFGTPFIEINVSAFTGSPAISYAFVDDLSDITEVDKTIRLGYNKIYLPDCQGKDTMFIGVTTDDSSTITLESFAAEVQRDLTFEEMPSLDPGESGTLTIGQDEWSSGYLKRLEVHYRDVYSG